MQTAHTHTHTLRSRLSFGIWQTAQVIDFTSEACWEISAGAIRDQRSSHCLTFIGWLTLWNFLCFYPCSDRSEVYKRKRTSFELINLTSSLTKNFYLIRGGHCIIGPLLIFKKKMNKALTSSAAINPSPWQCWLFMAPLKKASIIQQTYSQNDQTHYHGHS